MRKQSVIFFKILCSCLLLTSSFQLAANDATDSKDSKYSIAGNRSLPSAAYDLLQQQYSEECGEECQDCDECREKNKGANQVSKFADTAAKILPGTPKLGFYLTSHAGAIHYPWGVSVYGDCVELEDGSRWGISISDSYKTLNWMITDRVVITQNRDWFPSSQFKLENLETGVAVSADLIEYLSQFFQNYYNYHVLAINDYSQEIWLNDSTVWKVFDNDYPVVWESWDFNDTIIIGVNKGWYSSSYPNILINANTLQYVRAKCMN